jgi:ubiquinone/menaquinone biosynthesis C-methylase UbiE
MNSKEQKKLQKEYSDRVYKSYFRKGWQASSPRTLIGDFINYYPLEQAIRLLPFSLVGKTVLNICCGDGFEAEYLVKLGAKVTVLDISPEAVKATLRRCPEVKGVVADAEKLPFEDNKFDWVIVRAGLHHLPAPYRGIDEMNRVSRKGFIFIEAQKNFITEILIKSGLAEEYEKSGNYVYRFTRKEIYSLMRRLKIKKIKIKTLWCRYLAFLNKKVYVCLDKKYYLALFKFFFYTLNLIFGHFGNTMIVVGIKKKS